MLRQLGGPLWMMSEYGWYPLLLLLATPWFLHQLGTEQYGYWMLLTAAVSFGGMPNFGTGAATIKAVSAVIGRTGSLAGTEGTIRASLAIGVLGGLGFGLLVFVLLWFGGTTILREMDNVEFIRATALAAAAIILAEQLDHVFSSALKGAERFGRAARIEMLSKTLQVLACAVVAGLWPHLVPLYLTLVCVAVIRLVAKLSVFQSVFALQRLRPSLREVQEVLGFARWGWFQGIGNALFGVADRFLVGSMLGATSLSYYAVASQLAMQIHAASAAGLSVIFPKISRKLESRHEFSLWRVMQLTMAGNLLFSSLLAIVLLVFGPAILLLWLGPENAPLTAEILPWLAVAYWVLALNVVPYYLLLGLGRVRVLSITVVVAGIIGIILTYFAIARLGTVGAAVGRIAYAVLALSLFIPLVRYLQSGRAHTELRMAQVDNER